jgi:competence protein ComEA
MLRELRDWGEELACRAGVDAWPVAVRRVAVVVALALVALAVWRWGLAPGEEASGGGTPVPAPAGGVSRDATSGGTPAAPATITVHVVGAVRRPGVYVLPGGARATDAVAAAGGLLGNAEQGAVNLARVVSDGEQLVVPVQGAAAPGRPDGAAVGPGGRAGPASGGPVDLNTATLEQLDALPGIGPATAQKIVADRTENGPFRSVDDLLRVAGIGPAKLDALKDLVTVR